MRDDYGKLFFNILDYTGSATQKFADKEFDGDPVLITEHEIDALGQVVPGSETIVADAARVIAEEPAEYVTRPQISDDSEGPPRKYYFDGGQVEIISHLVYELDPDGKQLSVIKFTDYAGNTVRTLYPSAADLREWWADPRKRAEIIERLGARGIDFTALAEAAQQPEADPFDLLCHLAFNAPLRTRRERADRVRRDERVFFDHYAPDAKAILEELLEKYAEHGTAQFVIPDVLKVPPISTHGNIMEIAALFGGTESLRQAVSQLQTLLYEE